MADTMAFDDDSDDESYLPDIRISTSIFEVDPDEMMEEGECEPTPTGSYQIEIPDNFCNNPQLTILLDQPNFAQQGQQLQLMPPPPPPQRKSNRHPTIIPQSESHENLNKSNRHKQVSSTMTLHSIQNNSSAHSHSSSRSRSKQKSAFLDSNSNSNSHVTNLQNNQLRTNSNVQESSTVISPSPRSSSNSGGMVNNNRPSTSAALLNLQRVSSNKLSPNLSSTSTSSLSIINHKKPSRPQSVQLPSINTATSSSQAPKVQVQVSTIKPELKGLAKEYPKVNESLQVQVQVSTIKPELKGLAKEYPKVNESLLDAFALAKRAKRRMREKKSGEARKLLFIVKDQLVESYSALELDEKGNKKKDDENITSLPLEEKTFYYMLTIFISDLKARKCFSEDETKDINIIFNMLRRLIYHSSQTNYKTSLINILNCFHKTIGNVNNADGSLDLFRNTRIINFYDLMKQYKDDTPVSMMLPDYRVGVDGFFKKIVRVIKRSKVCTKETDKRKLLNTLVALMKIWKSNDLFTNN